jgi:hypothetical protein
METVSTLQPDYPPARCASYFFTACEPLFMYGIELDAKIQWQLISAPASACYISKTAYWFADRKDRLSFIQQRPASFKSSTGKR